MRTYRTEAQIGSDGELHLTKLPFQPGDDVDVYVFPKKKIHPTDRAFFLRGTPIRYDDPTEPVASKDWDALG